MISLVRTLKTDPIYFPLVEIRKHQPVISDYYEADRNNDLIKERITEINKLTSEHFIYLPEDDFELSFEYLKTLGCKNFLIPVDLVATNDSPDFAMERIRMISDRFHKLETLFPEVNFGIVLRFEKVLANFSHALMEAAKSKSKLNILLPLQQDKELADQISRSFGLIRYRGVKSFFMVAPWLLSYGWWESHIRSPYLGPRTFDIDISNRCNHSCHFCGLYGAEAMQEKKAELGEEKWQDIIRLKSLIVDKQQFYQTIDTLPHSVKFIQFGGAGEPTLHPNFMDFVDKVRQRGINLEILSHLSIFNEKDIHQLHSLGGSRWDNLHFIVNLSGPDAETYIATRPKQTEKDFHQVIRNLRLLTQLREKNHNRGVYFTLLMVLTNRNFHKCKEFVQLAKDVGAFRVFLKPMVVASNSHYGQLPNDVEMKEYDFHIRQGKDLAKKLDLVIV